MKLTPEIPPQFIYFHSPCPLLSAQQQHRHIKQDFTYYESGHLNGALSFN